ncbi:hypothetical protein [Cellulosilyticum sp. I15G10I2]|uniref:hypothetical protein n=1 Tax=Cellulosilyticum sp. I15G10I2 TaxID=1892843 RepID=UPI00085BF92E|nr:hypothetical protein [Cellulosilyticum sp. I15G10I2]
MRYYYLQISENNTILQVIDTFEEQENMVALTLEEYEKAQQYNKFNTETREFSELKPISEPKPSEFEALKQRLQSTEDALLFIMDMMGGM